MSALATVVFMDDYRHLMSSDVSDRPCDGLASVSSIFGGREVR